MTSSQSLCKSVVVSQIGQKMQAAFQPSAHVNLKLSPLESGRNRQGKRTLMPSLSSRSEGDENLVMEQKASFCEMKRDRLGMRAPGEETC
jgi:hypothetical protein